MAKNENKLKSRLAVTPSTQVKLLSFRVLFFLGLCILLLSFVPWQQTVTGTGKVTSFDPTDRPQQIEAPIMSRLGRWQVAEGDFVQEGQVLMTVEDLDKDFLAPELLGLLERSREAVLTGMTSYDLKVTALESTAIALNQNLSANLSAAKQNILAGEMIAKTTDLNLKRIQILEDKGLNSTRELELAKQTNQKAQADLAKNKLELAQLSSKYDSEVNKISSDRASAEADKAKLQEKLAELDLKIVNSTGRQRLWEIKAPRSGSLVRLLKRGAGETVKANEPLAVLTPQTKDQAAEIFISDIDAPLVAPGDRVRLQFAGWPALQFAGFSDSLSFGTFAGTVRVVDNVDSGNGNYRLLIVPEGNQQSWPRPSLLRPGTRVSAWVILKTVPLGYELWRRFNGFPIAITHLDKGETVPVLYDDSSSEGDEKPKGKELIYKKKAK